MLYFNMNVGRYPYRPSNNDLARLPATTHLALPGGQAERRRSVQRDVLSLRVAEADHCDHTASLPVWPHCLSGYLQVTEIKRLCCIVWRDGLDNLSDMDRPCLGMYCGRFTVERDHGEANYEE